MSHVLVLGGTGWLSGRIARLWVDRGASVTVLARGGRPAPAGAELVVADRASDDAYADVADREWDEVVDISSRQGHVSAALAALADLAAHWTYVSSVSVYARSDHAGDDESAELLQPAPAGDEEDYGRVKVACESRVRAVFGDRAAIVRPGLIVGPGDPTDRFGYWVSRFALAGGEAVLVPTTASRDIQVIDVDDLAPFVVSLGERRLGGVRNAVGDVVSFGEVVATGRAVAGHAGEIVEASDDWLVANDVNPWSGPRSLPLWLPGEMRGFMTRSHTVYRTEGGGLRPLHDTLERTLADERDRGLDRERRAGLTRADELALITALAT
jgi:nucleoside-diphosphate-sugar epimerase